MAGARSLPQRQESSSPGLNCWSRSSVNSRTNCSRGSLEATMCDLDAERGGRGQRTVPLHEAVGMVLAHDITEIRKDEFKGAAFKKGHVIRVEDVTHLKRLGKEHLFVLAVGPDEMHEDDAAAALAAALMGR